MLVENEGRRDDEILQRRAQQIIDLRRRHNASGQNGEDMENIMAALAAESTVQSTQGFWLDWVSHRGSKDTGGCRTHAVSMEEPSRAVCGVKTGGDGAVMTIEEAGGVGCLRCTMILKKRGVLFAATI